MREAKLRSWFYRPYVPAPSLPSRVVAIRRAREAMPTSIAKVSTKRQSIVSILVGLVVLGAVLAMMRLAFKSNQWLASLGDQLKAWLRVLSEPAHLPELLLGVAALLIVSLWGFPKLQVSRSQGLTADNRFDRENEARKTLSQIIGGALLLSGLYSSVQTFNLQREGQITDRYTKAIDQLGAVSPGGAANLGVRIGGIYALERIARDSPKDQPAIMEVLTFYVREYSKMKEAGDQSKPAPLDNGAVGQRSRGAVKQESIRSDIQTSLTVIGRRDVDNDSKDRLLDLHEINLDTADLRGAKLGGVDLQGASLRGAKLDRAILTGALLYGAHLEGAFLQQADLRATRLVGTFLLGAHLKQARLQGAYLNGVNLSRADLTGACLEKAYLNGANLNGATLYEAYLFNANGLKKQQIGAAYTDDLTALPASLKKPTDVVREPASCDLP